jgi:hypothetical protein
MNEPIHRYSQPDIPLGQSFTNDVVNRAGAAGNAKPDADYVNPKDYDNETDYAKALMQELRNHIQNGTLDDFLYLNGYDTGGAGLLAMNKYAQGVLGQTGMAVHNGEPQPTLKDQVQQDQLENSQPWQLGSGQNGEPQNDLPAWSGLDNAPTMEDIETAAQAEQVDEISTGVLPGESSSLEDEKSVQETHANDYNIELAFAGDAPELKDGEMYFVDLSGNIGEGIGFVRGKAILFDKDKYCIYEYWGVSGSVGLPLTAVSAKGVVTNVYDVSDYTGVFVNGTGGVLGIGTSKSLGVNRDKGGYVIQESTGVDVFGATAGTFYTDV